MKKAAALSLFCLSGLFPIPAALSDEPKDHDKDVVYDEAKVPPYDLPPLLVSSEGKLITTPEEWFNIRRPQIMALFGNLIYGIVPAPESPIRTTFELVRTNRDFMNGRATRKDVRIRFENAKGNTEMLILVFSPNGAAKPAPAFLLHSFANTRDDGRRVPTAVRGRGGGRGRRQVLGGFEVADLVYRCGWFRQ